MNFTWQAFRDGAIALGVFLIGAAVDFETTWIQSHPIGGSAVGLALIWLLSLVRRWFNPTVPAASVAAVWSFDDRVSVTDEGMLHDAPPMLSGVSVATPSRLTPPRAAGALALDFDTPQFTPSASFLIANALDDEQFLQTCAAQVAACTPGGKVKQFDPLTIGLILLRIFLTNVDIEALLEKSKQTILGWLARWKLRSAIKAAMLAEGDKWKPGIDEVDGFETWLTKADAGVIRRVRMIADSRRK